MTALTSTGSAAGVVPRGCGVAVAVCAVFGVVGWAFDLWFFRGAPLQDWMVFYAAGRAFLDGNLPLIFSGETLTAAINARFAGWLAMPLGLHPWVYPPPFLLMVLPFAMVPPAVSAAAFIGAGFAAAVLAARCAFERGAQRWLAWATLALCPAVPFDVLTGQNAFYTAALLLGGFAALPTRPVLCGLLLGLLSVKPQLCLMAGVALLAGRQWRALGAAAATAGGLAAASAALLGLGIWRAWAALLLGGDGLYRSWIEVGRLNGISVYACAHWLGAPAALASAAQGVASLAAAGVVYWVHRRPAVPGMRLAAVLAATLLAAPHASNSDALLLGLAAVAFMTAAGQSELRPHQSALCAALWIAPLFNPPVLFRIGCVTPLLVAALLATVVVALRGRRASGLGATLG